MALYHTYRPQKFSEIVGQDHIVQTLSNQIKKNSLAHAYLFSGPRGTGKTTTARIVAKAMNCQNKKDGEFEPCNECSACTDITAGKAIDVIEIDAASHTGVDHVREHIIENAQFRPTFLPYKIFIVDEVHMLSTSAFNALLKTLEEPPSHVIFILATTDLQKIPETIVSRCQRFTFHRMEETEAKAYLKKIASEEKRKIDDEVLDRIIQKSEGGMRDALSLLDQLLGLDEKHITLENASLLLPQVRSEDIHHMIQALQAANVSDCLQLLSDLREKGTHFMPFTDELILTLRDAMILVVQKKKTDVTISLPELFRLIEILLKRRQEIRSTPLPTLPLEMAFIEWLQPDVQNSAPAQKKVEEKKSEPTPVVAPTLKQQVQEIAVSPEIEEVPISPMEETVAPLEVPSPEDFEAKTQPDVLQETAAPDFNVEFQTIQKKWPEVLSRIEKESPSLVLILRMAKLVRLERDTVFLAVPYKFHQSKLLDKTNMRKVESTLQDIYSAKMHFDVIVEEKANENGEAQELAALLGGEVV